MVHWHPYSNFRVSLPEELKGNARISRQARDWEEHNHEGSQCMGHLEFEYCKSMEEGKAKLGTIFHAGQLYYECSLCRLALCESCMIESSKIR